MPNTREIVRALVSAFNVHNYARDTVKTNFTLQSRGGKDCIVVSFDKGMNDYQCSEYLYNIKRKIIGEFYGIEEGDTDEVVLNTAKLIFDVKSFPFNDYKGDWSVDKQGRIEFLAPIDQGVIFNLKSHLASSLKKDILEDMPVSGTTVPFNKGKYLCCSKFPDKESRQQFEREFLSRMRERYENVPKNPLKIEGNSVYIRDVFDDARFIDSVTRRVAWLVGRDLQADSKSRSDVRAFKDLIMEILDPSTRVVTSAFLCASPLNREETSILIPVILSNRGTRFLTKEEARDINHKFNNPVLDDISDKTQATFKVNGSSGIYGIDFSNKEISHCVITKIIESSVINKDHELAIDPELVRALSPAQSPFNSPTHAGPSGLETPPNPRKRNRDSGLGESPLKLEDFGVQSQVGMPNGPSSGLTELSSPIQEFPMRSQGEELEGSPRRGLEEVHMLPLGTRGVPGTSKGFSPSPQLNSIAVSYGVSGPSSPLQSLGAAKSGSAVTNPRAQPMSPWLSQGTSGNQWIPLMQLTKLGPSGLLWPQSGPPSLKDANPVGTNPWAQPMSPGLSQGTSGNRWPQLSSFVGRPSSFESMPAAQPQGRWSPPPPFIPIQRDVLLKDCQKICEDFEEAYEKIVSGSSDSPRQKFSLWQTQQMNFSRPSSSKGANEWGASDKPLTKEEKELFKELLYVFNLRNYTLGDVHTNFFAKDEKIVSLLGEIDREKYFQAVRDDIDDIEENCITEEAREEVRKVCDFDEFPFKLNYEEERGKTVVANISSGALSNLKILFSQWFGKDVNAININVVKKVKEYEREEEVERYLSNSHSSKEALGYCFPDEGPMKQFPIVFDEEEDRYLIDSNGDTRDVSSLWKKLRLKAKEGKHKKDSSEAEATTSSGYESMDCEDTGKRLLKRRSLSPPSGDDRSSKKSRSESSNSSSEEEVGSPRSNLSDSDSEGLCKGFRKAGVSK